ncbi:MAG TPA: four helix bundle protein [Thermodesulfovibrionales bacterium]|nr:four helix bundle protein [Thermodesulfovibrionales bacterium]
MANYKDLIVFQKSDELAYQLYKATDKFPKSELFGLTSQIRRAALSIPTNIVEGYARKSRKELGQFVNIALGSHAETEYLFDFSKRLGYFKTDTAQIENLLAEVGRLLWSFHRSL